MASATVFNWHVCPYFTNDKEKKFLMRNLVIVESPSKATTINSYLGNDYKVLASVGHVRDLPKSSFGVDIEHGFKLKYINIKLKQFYSFISK